MTYETMDPEVKVKWLEALRSGRFKQGGGFLKKGDCNCCLGVLAEINGVPMSEPDENNTERAYPFNFPRGSSKEGSLYESEDGIYKDVHHPPEGYCGISRKARNDLMNMNDGVAGFDQRSFEQIADFIEKNL